MLLALRFAGQHSPRGGLRAGSTGDRHPWPGARRTGRRGARRTGRPENRRDHGPMGRPDRRPAGGPDRRSRGRPTGRPERGRSHGPTGGPGDDTRARPTGHRKHRHGEDRNRRTALQPKREPQSAPRLSGRTNPPRKNHILPPGLQKKPGPNQTRKPRQTLDSLSCHCEEAAGRRDNLVLDSRPSSGNNEPVRLPQSAIINPKSEIQTACPRAFTRPGATR